MTVARVNADRGVVVSHNTLHTALAVIAHHFGVAADITRSQNSALGSKDLLVTVVGAHNSTFNAAALLALNELDSRGFEHVLSTLIHGALVKKRRWHEVAGLRRHLEIASTKNMAVRFLGENITLGVSRKKIVSCTILVRLIKQPVHGRTRVAEPLSHKCLIGATSTATNPANLGCDGIELHAELLVQPGVHSTNTTTAAVDLGSLLAYENLGTILYGRACSGAASVAGAKDEDLGLDGLDDVGIGDGLRLGRPAGSVERRRSRGRDVSRSSRVGQSGGGTSSQRACGGGACDKVAARNRAIHVHSFRCVEQLQRTESRRGNRAARRFSLVLECAGAAGRGRPKRSHCQEAHSFLKT